MAKTPALKTLLSGTDTRFKFVVLSDVHLGHRRTPTEFIIKNLKKFLGVHAQTASLDMIFIAGDVFERTLRFSSEDATISDLWIYNFLRMCKDLNIAVRVLEGTPSHDQEQSKRFDIINEVSQLNVDLKYHKTLTIEYLEKWDLNVLFIPDEWLGSPEKALENVKEVMHGKGLNQVDLAIMHGQFDYQVPEGINAPCHASEAYLSFVKYGVFIGHNHTRSSFKHIYAQGSFDRLSHGYEDPKGFISAEIRKDDTMHVSFVENTDAKVYITIHCERLSIEESYLKIDEIVKTLPEDSYVRIGVEKSHPLANSLTELVRKYPSMYWDKIIEKEEKETFQEIIDIPYEKFIITKDNIEELIMNRIGFSIAKESDLVVARKIVCEISSEVIET